MVVYGAVGCYYVFYVFYVIVYVCTVGVMLFVVVVYFVISGFCPTYAIMTRYFCLIFDFFANIFMTDFP